MRKIAGSCLAKKPLSTVKIGKIMNKLGYSVKKTNGHYKYYVEELQYDDIQRIIKNKVAEFDIRLF